MSGLGHPVTTGKKGTAGGDMQVITRAVGIPAFGAQPEAHVSFIGSFIFTEPGITINAEQTVFGGKSGKGGIATEAFPNPGSDQNLRIAPLVPLKGFIGLKQ